MRIKCKSYEAAEKLSNLFGESHIEREGKHTYLVVDKARRKREV